MRKLLRTVFGSHLYGLQTENSDRDWKELFIPSKADIFLSGPDQHVTETTGTDADRNSSSDTDVEKISLTKFVKLASKGEMIAIDMLHSAPEHWEYYSPGWEMLHRSRDMFYTKDMGAYVGYIRKQVAKYGFKGSRLDAVRRALESLPKTEGRIEDVWPELPVDGEFMFKGEMPQANGESMPYWEVVGKKFIPRAPIEQVIVPLEKFEQESGQRARLAAKNEGIDWKAVSHAYRACCQLIALYTEGDFSYPLPETYTILRIKQGQMDWQKEVQPLLEKGFDDVNLLAEESDLPTSVDRRQVNSLVMNIYAIEGYL